MSGVIEQYSLSDLPIDLLNAIAERLGYVDQIRFRSVCKSWRSNIKPSKHAKDKLPWEISCCNRKFHLYDPYQKKKYKLDKYFLRDSTIHASKHGWLLLSHPWTTPNPTFIFYTPFTHEIIQLPKQDTNMIMRGYSTRATFTSAPTSPDCLIFVLTVLSKKLRVSTCSRRNNKDKTWRWKNHLFDGDGHGNVESVAFSRGTFYCLFAKEVMGSFNVEQKQWRLLPYPSPKTDDELNILFDHHLIESQDGNLFAHCQRIDPLRVSKEVFLYDQVEMKWSKVGNLGDNIMFLGVSPMLLPAVEEASELANTIHRASRLSSRILGNRTYFGRTVEQMRAMYDWIDRVVTRKIWIQPIKWT